MACTVTHQHTSTPAHNPRHGTEKDRDGEGEGEGQRARVRAAHTHTHTTHNTTQHSEHIAPDTRHMQPFVRFAYGVHRSHHAPGYRVIRQHGTFE